MKHLDLESKLISVFLKNHSDLYVDLPFDKELSKSDKHLLLNKIAQEIFSEVSSVGKVDGHVVLGISFHPKYLEPHPIMIEVAATENPIKDKTKIYDAIVEEGLEIFCVVSSKYLILEDYFTKKEQGIYYAFGTSFGQERGTWEEATKEKKILTFSQPSKQIA